MKFLKKHLLSELLLSSLLIVTNVAQAQVGSLRMGQPTPTATSLGKFGDIPVSLYTGTPDISISLCEMKGRTLSVPITLRYHASGIRVEEVPGWVGMGWALDAGGVITRAVRGLPDDSPFGYRNTGDELDGTTNWPDPTQTYYESVKAEVVDPEPDQFFFQFGGRSGKLVMGSDGLFNPIPFQKVKVTYTMTSSGSDIDGFVIVTEDGTRYEFSEKEWTTDYPVGQVFEGNTTHIYVSSWYLKKIVSPAGNDEITFAYTSPVTATYQNQTYEELISMTQGEPCNPSGSSHFTKYDHGGRYLQSITTALYTASFSTSSRTDFIQEKKLDSFEITRNSQLVKGFVFEYGYHPGGETRLRLDRVKEKGSNGEFLPPYSFAYDGTQLPERLSKSIDHWGFSNGNSNSTLIPTVVYAGIVLLGADRRPDFNYSKAGTLTKINYPTGGSTEFFYESHDYGNVGGAWVTSGEDGGNHLASANAWDGSSMTTPFTVGGIAEAIVKISTNLNPSYEQVSPFSYVKIESADGQQVFYTTSKTEFTPILLSPGGYRLRAVSEAGTGTNADITVTWENIISLETKPAGGLRIKRVVSHDGISASNDVVREYRYLYSSLPDRSSGDLVTDPKYHFYFSGSTCAYLSRSSVPRGGLGMTQGSHIGYREVTELLGVNGEKGYTHYSFSSSSNSNYADVVSQAGWWPHQSRTSYDWKRGQLLTKAHYNNLETLLNQTTYTYNFTPGFNEKKVRAFTFKNFLHTWAEIVTAWAKFEVISAWLYLSSETTVSYDQNGQNPVTTTKQFSYENSDHIQLTKHQETNSDGAERITEYKYAHEKYPGMNASGAHMISQLYATTAKKGTSDAEAKKWTVWSNSDGYWRPREEWLWRGDGSDNDLNAPPDYGDSETFKSLTFEIYDSYGNLLQSKDANNVQNAHKWALGSTVPVAIFSNATNAQTFFDEFGDGDYSGWTITDVNNDGDTQWAVENGKLKQTNYASAADGECDRIVYDLGTEITGNVVLEFDLITANPNYWDLIIAMGGDQWNGGNGGTENAVWTAFIDNTAWYVYNTNWTVIQSGFTTGSKHHFKIVAKCSAGKADYYVDGNRVRTDVNFRYSTSGIRKVSFGNYGYSSNTSVWYIDNVRLYPDAALAKTVSYDPITLLTTETHDESGAVTKYEYDSFQRLMRVLSPDNRVISENKYYHSRLGNGDEFNASDPNYVETTAFPESAPTNGLVGHWRLEGNGIDETGNNNLNLVGTAWGNGYLGSAKTFDGTKTKYAHAPLISAYQTQRPTVTGWVKIPSASTGFSVAILSVQGAWTDGRGLQLTINGSSKASFSVGNASGAWKSVTGATTLQTNTWYHLAGTYDGTYLRVYVDGVEDGYNNIGSVTISYTPRSGYGPNPSTFYVGIMHNANNSPPTNDPDLAYPFNGSIDDVRIYNRSLTTAEIKSLANPNVMTTYVDGLGRDIQTQVLLGNEHIVSGKKYDALGREWKIIKPYLYNSTAYTYRYDASDLSNSNNYYAAMDNSEADTEGYPYTEFEYLPDPLNRLKRQAAPGAAFRMGTGKEVKAEYWSNGGTDVANYGANTLFKTRRIDEDGKVVDTFADKFGNTVAMTVDPGGPENLKTTFEYDVLGNMTKSTPPKGSLWATTNKYTTLQQLREKTNSDAGTMKYLYDKTGNLRLAKDANHTGSTNSVSISGNLPYLGTASGSFTMALPGKLNIAMTRPGTCDPGSYVQTKIKTADGTVLGTYWTDQPSYSNSIILPKGSYLYEVTTDIAYCTSGYPTYSITANLGYELVYHKYDVFNRVSEIGEYESNSTGSLTQANADNSSYPTSGLIYSHKFAYDYPSSDPLAAGQRNLKGRLSAAESYRLGALALTTFYSYDELGRVEWVLHKGFGSYYKKLKYTYDLQDRVTKKEYIDAQNSSYNLYTYYDYDQTGRVKKVSTNTTDNPGTATKEGEYTYYAASTSKDLKLGNSIQQVDYRYNTRDWLVRINDVDNAGSDKFGQKLLYQPANYNGNVSETHWFNGGVSTTSTLGYAYSYDRANRQEYAEAYIDYDQQNNYTEPMITYDVNGNILTYQRYDHDGNPMDNLTYNYYTNTNRLSYIADAVNTPSITTDIENQSSGNYTYDANGNMAKDAQRSVGFIIYDMNNQPISVYKTNGTLYKYFYDTQGNRVRKEEGTTEYYVQGANGSTEAVVKSDGSQATHNVAGNDVIGQVKRTSTAWSRYYYLKDHLGSVRVIVNSSGTADSYQDFYPFGMTMEQRSGSGSGDGRYTFTGYEKNTQTGTLHAGQREYLPLEGKFNKVDRFDFKYPSLSPYGYAANNPALYVDVNGDTVIYNWQSQRQQGQFAQIRSGNPDIDYIFSVLEQSESKYFFNVDPEQVAASQIDGAYVPNTNGSKIANGGSMWVEGVEAGLIRHEGFHAFEHERMGSKAYGDYIATTSAESHAYILNAMAGDKVGPKKIREAAGGWVSVHRAGRATGPAWDQLQSAVYEKYRGRISKNGGLNRSRTLREIVKQMRRK